MRDASSLREVPAEPAVYALVGGRGGQPQLGYVGIADRLRPRLEQHLLRRDSSVVASSGLVRLDPDQVTEVRWWQHPSFTERASLEAAEMVAAEALSPTVRSRGRPSVEARAIAADPVRAEAYRALFAGPPSGRLMLPTLRDALERIAALERRLDSIAARVDALADNGNGPA